VAHLVFKVADLKSSCQFYLKLGLPPFATDEKVAIIELRGGTHLLLLLLSVDEPAGEDIAESLTGQFHKRFSEQFDLMIEGKGLDELKKYRSELLSRGIAAGDIPDETFFGHYLFCIRDPDGNGITIYTSHAN
jgi:catechol 2,3-dioxygenase-like lactoylglutathione lyase family enzyme